MSTTDDVQQKRIRAWCLYDWANSAFATTVMVALYPPFFRSLATSAGLPGHLATAFWGYTTAVALLIVALAGPVLGAIADAAGARKRFLGFFISLGVAATLAFLLNGDDTWLLAAGLFVIAQISFAGANVFYEALLPVIATPESYDRISTRAYALGYLGGGILLVINVAWVLWPHVFAMPSAEYAVRASFVSVALWWATFSVPVLRWVREPVTSHRSSRNLVREGASRLAATFREVRRYRQLLLFLVAFWIYNDGISTIMKMATAFGDEIGIELSHLITALILTQLVGAPCSVLFGRLASRWGAKRSILLALSVYAAISCAAFFMRTAAHFYVLAVLVGTVQGGSQALSRSLFATMVPAHKTAEFFGFFSTSAKLAGIFGPLLFALVAQLTGASRLSVVSLVVFFCVGGLLLLRVDPEQGAIEARAGAAQGRSA